MYAGELLPLKGLSLALRALTHMPDWTFDIYGDGPDKARLEKIAKQLSIAERVRFHGWVSREEVFTAMAEADVFLFPSLHDEVGWVVAEALMHGLPVVSLDRGGPRSLGAIAVPLGRPDHTARSMAEEAQRAFAAEPRDWTLSTRYEALRSILKDRGVI
jgi:glycosyltransferase involved in cell wall biosynthesis